MQKDMHSTASQQRSHWFQNSAASRPLQRRGTAQMELTLFLPIYATFIMLMFTAFSFAQTRAKVSIEARHEAWQKRKNVASRTNHTEIPTRDIGRILNGSQDARRGLVRASRTKDAIIYLGLDGLLPEIADKHAVLSESWDYESIPFEQKSEHRHLEMDQRVRVFSAQPEQFLSLNSFGAVFGGAGRLLDAASTAAQDARRELTEDANQLRAEVATLSRELSRLQDQMARLEQQEPRDDGEIRRVRDRIRERQRRIRERRQQLQHLDSGLAHI